jgi:hypothetical protein
MPVLSKSAALLGLTAADRALFAPVAAPLGQQQLAYQPAVYAPSVEAVAPMNLVQPVEYAQPVEYVQYEYAAAEPQGADSQFWLWTGVGALAVLGAAAARRSEPTAVADLDEEDLESAARIATLAVGGKGTPKKGFNLTEFLMSGRKSLEKGNKGKEVEMELLLSGANKPGSDSKARLDNRFRVSYDTRGLRQGGRVVNRKTAQKQETDKRGAWRSKNPTKSLY